MSEALESSLTVLPASAISTIVAADPDDILGKLARKVAAFKPDISTPAGRDEMRSLAYEIARNKTALIKIGKGLTEGWRKATKAVNEECNVIEQRMDELRDRVRAPLTAWENAEKERVAAHEAALDRLQEAPSFYAAENSSEDLKRRLEWLQSRPARDWQEFAQRAADTLASEIAQTETALAAALKREAEAAELARLRAEAAERQRQAEEQARREREERIAAEAAERARVAAEQAAERRAEEERQAAARREREALEAAARAEEQARQAEAARAAAERRAEQERIEAEQRAERQRQAAVEAERRRIEQERAAAEAEAARRAADKEHRATINRKALAALVNLGISDDHGKLVIAAVARGEIPHMKVVY